MKYINYRLIIVVFSLLPIFLIDQSSPKNLFTHFMIELSFVSLPFFPNQQNNSNTSWRTSNKIFRRKFIRNATIWIQKLSSRSLDFDLAASVFIITYIYIYFISGNQWNLHPIIMKLWNTANIYIFYSPKIIWIE